jgi:hypothetical protein
MNVLIFSNCISKGYVKYISNQFHENDIVYIYDLKRNQIFTKTFDHISPDTVIDDCERQRLDIVFFQFIKSLSKIHSDKKKVHFDIQYDFLKELTRLYEKHAFIDWLIKDISFDRVFIDENAIGERIVIANYFEDVSIMSGQSDTRDYKKYALIDGFKRSIHPLFIKILLKFLSGFYFFYSFKQFKLYRPNRTIFFDPIACSPNLINKLFGSSFSSVMFPKTFASLSYISIFKELIKNNISVLFYQNSINKNKSSINVTPPLEYDFFKKFASDELSPKISNQSSCLFIKDVFEIYKNLINKYEALNASAQSLLDNIEYGAIVVPSSDNELYRVISKLIKSTKVNLIVYQHGVIARYERWPDLSSNAKYLFYSINDRSVFCNLKDVDINSTNVEFMSKSLYYHTGKNVKSKKYDVLIILQPHVGLSLLDKHGDIYKVLNELAIIVSRMPKIKFAILPHPEDIYVEYSSIVFLPFENLLNAYLVTSGCESVLDNCTVVISEFSTCLNTALIYKKKSISINFRNYTSIVSPYLENQDVVKINSIVELQKQLISLEG